MPADQSPEAAYEEVLQVALKLLGRRMYTELELGKKLKDKELGTPHIRGRVMRRLQELKLVDDREYAEAWIRNRSNTNPRGVYVLRRELKRKGVEQAVIDTALERTPVDEIALALRIAQKKLMSLSKLPQEKQYQRILGLLQRKGFSYGVAKRVWEELS